MGRRRVLIATLVAALLAGPVPARAQEAPPGAVEATAPDGAAVTPEELAAREAAGAPIEVLPEQAPPVFPSDPTPPVAWPAGRFEAPVATGAAFRVGESPVWLTVPADALPPGATSVVVVADQRSSRQVTPLDLLFDVHFVDRAGARLQPGVPVVVEVETALLGDRLSGDLRDRVRLVAVPACARPGQRSGADRCGVLDLPDEDAVADGDRIAVGPETGADAPDSSPAVVVPGRFDGDATGVREDGRVGATVPPAWFESVGGAVPPAEDVVPAADAVPAEDAPVGEVAPADDVTPTTLHAARPAPAGGAGGGGGFALMAGSAGPSGDFGATPWTSLVSTQVGRQSGSFETSIEIPVPNGIEGIQPTVTLGYSSATVDGMTTGKNTQGGVVGLGWNLDVGGAVTQEFRTCAIQGGSGSAPGDLCWAGENYSIQVGGISSRLVFMENVGTDRRRYRLESDPMWRVDRVQKYTSDLVDPYIWEVTTPDGTIYRFGEVAEQTSGQPTQAQWWVPVYHPSSGDPCYSKANRMCRMAIRWALSSVTEVHGLTASYFYVTETNRYYARGGLLPGLEYVRDQVIDRIEYTKKSGYQRVQPPVGQGLQPWESMGTARVTFSYLGRCLEANPANCTVATWQDTPIDQMCETSPCPSSLGAPTFFSRYRLATIRTFSRGIGPPSEWAGMAKVDEFHLGHEWRTPSYGGTGETRLWLRGFQRTGMHTATGWIIFPLVQFGSVMLHNRVNDPVGGHMMDMPRIETITNGVGGTTTVQYFESHPCPRATPIDFTNFAKSCFPQFFSWAGQSTWDAFVQYAVQQVTETTAHGGSPPVVTTYAYDAPAWHYSDEPTLPHINAPCPGSPAPSMCSMRNWNEFRGYGEVRSRRPNGTSTSGWDISWYHRGMHGDRANHSGTTTKTVNITLPDGTTRQDSDWLAGREVAHRNTLADASLTPMDQVIRTYSVLQTAAAGGLTARFVDVGREVSTTFGSTADLTVTLDHQIWHDFNAGGLSAPYYGNVVGETWSSNDLAFVTRSRELHYVNNSAAWILGLPRDVIDEQTTSPSLSGPIIRRTMTYYDGSLSSTATPTRGDVTRVDRLRDGAVMTTSTTLDALGRPATVTAPGSRSTTYTYAMAGYVASVTNPLGHVTTTLTDTGYGLPLLVEVRASSAGPVTSSTSYRYDAGGRLLGVTQPGDSFETIEFGYGFTSNGQPQAWSWPRGEQRDRCWRWRPRRWFTVEWISPTHRCPAAQPSKSVFYRLSYCCC